MRITAHDIIRTRKPRPAFLIIKEIADRFSPRHYSSKKIPIKVVRTIFEAARWAPSGYNAQPWYFYWTENSSPTFKKILSSLSDFNLWAKTASILIVACYIKRGEKGKNEFAIYDLGAAVLALILQAQSLGYYARQMGIFDQEKVRQIIGAQNYEKPYVIVALGRLGDYAQAPEDIIKRDLTPTPRKTDLARKI